MQNNIAQFTGALRRHQRRISIAIFSALSLFLALGGSAALAQDAGETADAGPPLCRFGVNVNQAHDEPGIEAFDTATLRLGWYIDYRAQTAPARPQGMDYAPVIRLSQVGADGYETAPSGQALDDAILALKGQRMRWYVGNEPDRIQWQDDIMPAVYAKAYHELRERIKALDPSAQVVAGSIVQATEVRMKYLDLILAAHQQQYGEPMAVDAWAIHGFILREASCQYYPPQECWGADIPPGVDDHEGLLIGVQQNDDFGIFKANVIRMRQWMADNGYRNTPLYLSEYGVLMPSGLFNPDFTPERVNAFMTKSFDFLLTEGVDDQTGYPLDSNRLVQQLSWYSTSDSQDFNGNLFTLGNSNEVLGLSPMGQNYANYTAQVADEFDFAPTTFSVESPIVILSQGGSQRAVVTIGVTLANGGNNHTPVAAPVRLYNGNPGTSGTPLADGVVQAIGCGQESLGYVTVPIPWDGVSLDTLPSTLSLYALANPDSVLDETNRDNNGLAGQVSLEGVETVNGNARGFLPLVWR